MITFVLAFAGFCLAFFLLSLGYIISRKILRGSCGNIEDAGGERVCNCEKPCFARRMRMRMEERRKTAAGAVTGSDLTAPESSGDPAASLNMSSGSDAGSGEAR